ncbi:MAG: hypothetical protein U0744_06730 [Gemmataceae bacterium]
MSRDAPPPGPDAAFVDSLRVDLRRLAEANADIEIGAFTDATLSEIMGSLIRREHPDDVAVHLAVRGFPKRSAIAVVVGIDRWLQSDAYKQAVRQVHLGEADVRMKVGFAMALVAGTAASAIEMRARYEDWAPLAGSVATVTAGLGVVHFLRGLFDPYRWRT